MQVQITGRHCEISDAIRNQIDERMEKMENYLQHVLDVQITLSMEKSRQKAEINVRTPQGIVIANDQSHDMAQSVDSAFDKLVTQFRRKRDRTLKRRQQRSTEAELIEPISKVRLDVISREPEADLTKLIRSREVSVKPMTFDEAVRQMDVIEKDFYVFRNAETDELNIVYRRKDGNLGLLEPE